MLAGASSASRRRQRICFVVAVPLTARAFLRDHMAALSEYYDVDLVADVKDPSAYDGLPGPVNVISAPISRAVSPVRDLRALTTLWRIFRKGGYAAVHTLTPKAGLLGQLAARLAGVPIRCHTFTGQVWVTRHGLARYLLKSADRLIAALATHILVDSPSQRDFIVGEGVVSLAKADVLGDGAVCGVDTGRFRPDANRRARVRKTHGIPESAVVFLFLGRLNREKGVLDLARAFGRLADEQTWLLFVGPDEDGLGEQLRADLGRAADRTVFVGYTTSPEDYMAAADVFCLPSYREGFGMVAIEAAAAGLPAIASRIYGITDAVADGETGILHAPGEVREIVDAMKRLLGDEDRGRLGDAARQRAAVRFSRERLSGALLSYYHALLRPETAGRTAREDIG